MLIIILFLSSCLFKENKIDNYKKEIVLGKLIKEKLKLKINLEDDIKIFLKNDELSTEGVRKDNFYEFLIEKEGFYKLVADSEQYVVKNTKISIFKSGTNFYYKGPEEILIDKIFKNETIKIVSEKREEIFEEKTIKLINLDVKTKVEVCNESFNKPELISLKPLCNQNIDELYIYNSKFANNDIGDYFEMPSEVAKKEQLFGEGLKKNLSYNKDLILTFTNIFSNMFFKPSAFAEEDLKKEDYKMKEEQNKNNNDSTQVFNYQAYNPNPKDIEEIRLKKQKENCDVLKVKQKLIETVNNILKNTPNSEGNPALEILNKVYNLFKK